VVGVPPTGLPRLELMASAISISH